jgi:hypothetical protein
MRINGKCHCGNIVFSLELPGESPAIPARVCSCSFCLKHGGVWTSHPTASLLVSIEDSHLVSKYAFGTQTAAFHVCSRCGTVPFVTSEIDDRLYAVVNVNAFENVDRLSVRQSAVSFEGEELEARLERRKRNWIADVRITARNA